jgi:hypothetical protein
MLGDPAILERVINSKRGGFPPDLARQVLGFTFPPKDRQRYKTLSREAQNVKLTAKERAGLEDYLNVNDLIGSHSLLRAEALRPRVSWHGYESLPATPG